MKNKLTIMDIKGALWDKRFQELFPEFKEQFKQFFHDPGCGCNHGMLRQLMKYKDRLSQYFPNKEIKTPEEEEVEIGLNDWHVINCPIDQLEDRLKKIPKGKRLVAISRFKDRITAIINDALAAMAVPTKKIEEHISDAKTAAMNWRVINTTIHELVHELRKLPPGRKMVQISRFNDRITLIVNDLTVLF